MKTTPVKVIAPAILTEPKDVPIPITLLVDVPIFITGVRVPTFKVPANRFIVPILS
jgi:hypothetical protein